MVSLPSIPNPFGSVDKLLGSVASDFSSWAKRYLWNPIKAFFDGIITVFGLISIVATATTRVLVLVIKKNAAFWDDPAQFLAHWLIVGFTWWIDEVVDLIESVIDNAWGSTGEEQNPTAISKPTASKQ